jgi:hypothetical protein
MLLKRLVVIGILLLAVGAQAGTIPDEFFANIMPKDAMTAIDLIDICKQKEGAVLCMAYVSGAFDMYRILNEIIGHATNRETQFGCVYKGYTAEDFVAYLLTTEDLIREDPKTMKMPLAVYMYLVFSDNDCQ